MATSVCNHAARIVSVVAKSLTARSFGSRSRISRIATSMFPPTRLQVHSEAGCGRLTSYTPRLKGALQPERLRSSASSHSSNVGTAETKDATGRFKSTPGNQRLFSMAQTDLYELAPLLRRRRNAHRRWTIALG